MPKASKRKAKGDAMDDHEKLQALDESNIKWVKEWKHAVAEKKKKQ